MWTGAIRVKWLINLVWMKCFHKWLQGLRQSWKCGPLLPLSGQSSESRLTFTPAEHFWVARRWSGSRLEGGVAACELHLLLVLHLQHRQRLWHFCRQQSAANVRLPDEALPHGDLVRTVHFDFVHVVSLKAENELTVCIAHFQGGNQHKQAPRF